MRTPSKHVLIVEDDPELCAVETEILEAEGYEVTVALDGTQALARLRSSGRLPCVILLDLMMPGMNGWQFRSEQLGDPTLASIPVVITSADTSVHEKARSIRAAGVLQKPLHLDDLLETVGHYCSSG